MIYTTFAALYDQLFDPTEYQRWHDYTTRCLANDDQVLLDLAGGSGRLSVMLANDGYQVTDVDFSSTMLSLAEARARKNDVTVDLVESDMRDLSGLGSFDAVTCYADSLCYLASLADVQRTFAQVAAHLKSGGRFLFDVWSLYQVDQVFPGYCYNYESDDGQTAFLWRSYADDDVNHGVIHELTFFNQQADGYYRRQHETHFERSYPLGQWQSVLQEAGFQKINVSADFGQAKLKARTSRWFFQCQKR